MGKTACSGTDTLAKETVLAFLWKPGLEEVQKLEILPTSGTMPDDGWFTLRVQNRSTTRCYFTTNSSANTAYLHKVITPIVDVNVTAVTYSQFLITFKNTNGATNIPLMTLQENQLVSTSTGTNAGTVQITTKVDGSAATGYGYTFLKSIPSNLWNITSFDSKTGRVCIEIHTNMGWVKKTDGSLQRSPNNITITLLP